MKTKAILLGVVVAALSALTLSEAKAQGTEQPAVRVVSSNQDNIIKLIYGYDSEKTVDVRFLDGNGTIVSDKIQGKSFEKGFIKKYKVELSKRNDFWVEVTNTELSVTYRMSKGEDGKWAAQLEKATYNYPVVASK